MIEYNDRKFYDCFNNTFLVYFGSPALNIYPIPIDDSSHPNKRSRYTSNPLPDDISFTSIKSVITLITPSDYPQIIEPNYDDPDTLHAITIDNP